MARNPDIDLWALDECHFQQHGSRCIMWVPPEDKDPVVRHAPTRKSIALFGAVNIRSGKLVTMLISTFDSEAFEVFLSLLLRHRSRRCPKTVLIVDNAAYHKESALQNCCSRSSSKVRLDFLPPYSPELNPIERVWKLLRTIRIHNQYFPTLDSLVVAVTEQLALWAKPNRTLAKLCGIT
jgi:transposase